MKPPYIILSIGVTLILSSILSSILSVSATVPTGVPPGSSTPNGGWFQKYFDNMIQTTPCSSGNVITGFNTSPGINYGVRTCSSVKTLMSAIYGTSSAPVNTVFDGYLSNGDIRWSPMTTWLKSGTALYYNGGNVGIGTASPTTKLEVAGVTKVDKIQLGNKVVLSGVGDAHGNDGWIRVFDVSQQNNPTGGIAYGNNGIAAANLWARDNVYAGRVTSSNMTVYTTPTAPTDVANKAYVDGKIITLCGMFSGYKWDIGSQTCTNRGSECGGNGYMGGIPDGCMHDGGPSAGGDALQVYCDYGYVRLCLSGEACQWRSGSYTNLPAGNRFGAYGNAAYTYCGDTSMRNWNYTLTGHW